MKTVLITGCSKGGIGYFLCEEFVKAGCKVFASARRLEAMRGLDALGCTLLQLDVQSEASCKKAVQAVIAEAGHIDVLVNNAGVAYSGARNARFLLQLAHDHTLALACFQVKPSQHASG